MRTVTPASLPLLLAVLSCGGLAAQDYQLRSPDGTLTASIEAAAKVSVTVSVDESELFCIAALGMELGDGAVIGQDVKVRSADRNTADTLLEAPFSTKASVIRDHYRALTLECEGDFRVEFRAYDDGFAYRIVTDLEGDIIVTNEQMDLALGQSHTAWFPEEETLVSHYERTYEMGAVGSIEEGKFCSLPLLVGAVEGTKVCISESDLDDYPNLFLRKSGEAGFSALFPKHVIEAVPAEGRGADRDQVIRKEADYIARTKGERSFPWRVFVVGDDAAIMESTLVWQLASPCQLQRTDWIEPGQIAWDWYNANNIYGVDFASGLTTETYKYYIDFASSKGIRYVILDEGWSKSTTEIRAPSDILDVEELIRYGTTKNVRIILWVLWGPLYEDIPGILKLYRQWGAAGVKVDFMARADQEMVNYYRDVGLEAAKHELLVDYHGAYKPTGLHRTLPNVMTFEGVKGNEYNKWSRDVDPDHNLTLPFTRMVAGPMDYTPGAMANAGKANHGISFYRPVGQGTRCHEIAKYVVFESPLQMLCDSPSRYLREQACTDFIVDIPQTWDETRVLEARVSDYVVVARRKGQHWYLAAMTDWSPRSFEIPLDFLPESSHFQARIMQDGVNAARFAEDYRSRNMDVHAGEILQANLAPGGGWAAILTRTGR